jgi:cytochrome P450
MSEDARVRHRFPPGPRGGPVLGNSFAYLRDPLGYLAAAVAAHGDIVKLTLGNLTTYVLVNPEHIDYVLRSHADNFMKDRMTRWLIPLVGEGLLTSEGAVWRRQRRLTQPTFQRQQIERYATVMVEQTERMLAGWHEGEVRDLHNDMSRLTLAIVAQTLFGTDLSAEADVIGESLEVVLNHFMSPMRWFPFIDYLPLPSSRRYWHAVLAGHETTALVLFYAFYLLAGSPETADRLAAELSEVLGGRAPTAADTPNLRYTEWVVRESMRLYPPAWGIAREALADCEIGGYFVPRGTQLFMVQRLVHRDRRWFDDPEAFMPERWDNDLIKRLPRCAYFPFGDGPRICIGNHFAMMESVLILATVAQRFHLTIEPGQTLELLPSITLRPRHPISMRLTSASRTTERIASGQPVGHGSVGSV